MALPRAGRSRLAARRRRAGILFSLPVVVLVGAMLLLPVRQTVYYSFTNWDGFTATWIGAANYRHLFHDSFIKVLVRRLHSAHEALAHPRRIF